MTTLSKDPVHISVALAEWLASLSDKSNPNNNDNKTDNPTP